MTATDAPAPTPALTALFDRVTAALATRRSDPGPVTEAVLRVARTDWAEACLSMDAAGVDWLATAPRIDLLGVLLRCGLRVLPPDDREAALIARARAAVTATASATDAPWRWAAAAAAFCLLRPPHELPALPDWRVMDGAIQDLAFRVTFAEPEFFVGLGEAETYGVFLERLMLGVLRMTEDEGVPLERRRDLARRVAFNGRFLLAYFNERNLKPVYQARARLHEFLLSSAGLPLNAPFPPRPADRQRFRVGVLRQNWTASAETAATLAHINGIDRGRFEVIAYTQVAVDDAVERVVRGRVDRFVVVSGQSVADAVRQLRGDDLDILLIGTNVTGGPHFLVLLTTLRLARVQIALTLCPATTGLRSMDYFLNGVLNEPEDAQAEYTEKLLLLPGSINRYDFSGEPVPELVSQSRAGLGLAEDAFVFASGANFYKLAPELLECWAGILRAVPRGVLLLYPFNPNWTNDYPVEVFARHLRGFFAQRGVGPERVRIVGPWPTRAHIHGVLRCVDLYLDSFPFSGAVSMLDPASVACPVVMRAGRPARNRQSAGMHADIGLGGVVTQTAADYAAAAIRLAGDEGALNALRVEALAAREQVRAATTLDLTPALLSVLAGA